MCEAPRTESERQSRATRRCSLCDCARDDKGKPPTILTRGGWVAHESCIAPFPQIRAKHPKEETP